MCQPIPSVFLSVPAPAAEVENETQQAAPPGGWARGVWDYEKAPVVEDASDNEQDDDAPPVVAAPPHQFSFNLPAAANADEAEPKGDAPLDTSSLKQEPNAVGKFTNFFQNLAAVATSNGMNMDMDDTQTLHAAAAAAAAAAKVASTESNGEPAANDFMDTHEVYVEEKPIQGGGQNKKQKLEREKGMTSLEAAARAAEESAAAATEGYYDPDL